MGRGQPKDAWADDLVTLMHIDISRAYFHAPAKEDKYIVIPPEDWASEDDGMCGKLNVSLYGTRDAAQNWAHCYGDIEKCRVGRKGKRRGPIASCPNVSVSCSLRSSLMKS